eukprot:6589432-Ditylum_brightwellii.AAC.2
MIQHYEARLCNLHLDVIMTANDFINNFQLCVQKLGELEGIVLSDEKKIKEFKEKVINEDYNTKCCIHTGDFKSLMQTICKCKTILSDHSEPKKHQHQFQRKEYGDNEGK